MVVTPPDDVYDQVVSLSEFCAVLADYFSMDDEMVTPEALLNDDLRFDSIQVFELFMMLEDAAKCEIADELMETVHTVADVYALYVKYDSH